MSVKINAVLVCSLSLLLSACSGRASARAAPKTLKYRLKWIRYFAIIKRVRYFTPCQCLTLSGANPAAIFANIDQPASARAKCSVRFMLQRDGTVQDPTVESGDRPFARR